ncbi:MAG: hypothetical protein GC152_03175 [Alphaproteobacteria bacterium]|nr:hypothetical protein [Alphaproteobacteria bacterium]
MTVIPSSSALVARSGARRTRIAVALFAGAALSACVTEDTALLREDPAYTRGYGDGCFTSGEMEKSFSTKKRRDDYEFDNSRAYRAGWRQGFAQCKNPVAEAETGGRILGEQPDTF